MAPRKKKDKEASAPTVESERPADQQAQRPVDPENERLRTKVLDIYDLTASLYPRETAIPPGYSGFDAFYTTGYQPELVVISSLLCEQNCMLTGSPGTGKSESTQFLSSFIFSLPYQVVEEVRIQGTPDINENSLIANLDLPALNDGRKVNQWAVRAFSPTVMVDEGNRTPPHIQSEFLRIFQEGVWAYMDSAIANKPIGIMTINTGGGVFDLLPALLNRFPVYIQFDPADALTTRVVLTDQYQDFKKDVLSTMSDAPRAKRIHDAVALFNRDEIGDKTKLLKALSSFGVNGAEGYALIIKAGAVIPQELTDEVKGQLDSKSYLPALFDQFSNYHKPDVDEVKAVIGDARKEYAENVKIPFVGNRGEGVASPLTPEELCAIKKRVDAVELGEDNSYFFAYVIDSLNWAGPDPVSDSLSSKKSIREGHFNQSYASRMQYPESVRNIKAAEHLAKSISWILGQETVLPQIAEMAIMYVIPPGYVNECDDQRQVREIVHDIRDNYAKPRGNNRTVQTEWKELLDTMSEEAVVDPADEKAPEKAKKVVVDKIKGIVSKEYVKNDGAFAKRVHSYDPALYKDTYIGGV